MANWYCNFGDGATTGYFAVPQFAINTAYVSTSNGGRGDYVRQLAAPAFGNERVFRCTTSGTSAGSEPSWNVNKGGTTTSNTAVFTECTGAEAEQATNAWKAPHARIRNAATFMASGDTMVVASAHAETSSVDNEPLSPGPGSTIIVVNAATASVPPVASDVTTGASITCSGSANMRMDGSWDIWGLTLIAPASGTLFLCYYSSSTAQQRYHNCALTGGAVNSFCSSNNGTIVFDNTTINPRSAQIIITGDIYWKNTPNGGLVGSPTNFLFQVTDAKLFIEGVDLSALNSGSLVNAGTQIIGSAMFKDCKIGASVSGLLRTGSPGTIVDCINCYDGTGQYKRARDTFMGTLRTSVSLYRTSGASDTAGFSYKIVTTSNSRWQTPFEAPPGMSWCGTTGANVNVTGFGIVNSASLPNNDGVWIEVEYMGSASLAPGYFATGTKANPLTTATALIADTSAWDAGVTARQNSHAYVLGDQIKVATNPGRVFFCTTAGTTAGSEPGGYATAVDGGSVTDSGAVFRAGQRFKITVALTSPQPASPGLVSMTWKAATASSTFWLDPKPGVV